jgi:1-pyrroline-5-carboxylate dehydrogenase
VIGDPTARSVNMGPVVNRSSYRDYQNFAEDLSQHGQHSDWRAGAGGRRFGKGYFVRPTLVDDLPLEHDLWKTEMFVPITTIARWAIWKRPCAWPTT